MEEKEITRVEDVSEETLAEISGNGDSDEQRDNDMEIPKG